jgi:4-amino-4-deoxy-L-arabinose transferase-like glycosyltransferase
VTKKKKRSRPAPAPSETGRTPAKQTKRVIAAAAESPERTESPTAGRTGDRAKKPSSSPAPSTVSGRDWKTISLGSAVSLVALILYLLTAARDVITGDTPDFLIAAKTLGVAHPPGYPLLSMLGHVFSWLPVGSTAFRIGLLAVVCSTATVALVFATVWRLTSLRAPAAAAGLALAFTPVFWRWSLQIETFPLNNVLVALVVYLLVRWHQDPVQRKFLLGAAFAFGLGLTNQQTIVLLVPAIAWLLWLHRQQLNRERRTIAYAAVAVVAGLVPYAYVPLAAMGHSPENWDFVHSFSAFKQLLLRAYYGGVISQGSGGTPTGSNVAVRSWYLVRGLGAVVGVFSLLGIVYVFRRLRWYFWFALLAVVGSGVGFMFATNLDPTTSIGLFVLERFFLMPLVVAAPLVGFGVIWLGQMVAERRRSIDRQKAIGGFAALVVAASLVVVGLNYSTVNVSNDHVAGNYARDEVAGLKPHTILFANDESDVTTLYMTTVARVRPDVTVVLGSLLGSPWYVQLLRHNDQLNVPAHVSTLSIMRANATRPIAFTGQPPDNSLNGKYYLYPDGLVSYPRLVGHPVLVTQDESDNEAQLSRLHVPDYRSIKPDSNEQAILDAYAAVPYRIGQAYALAGNKPEAIVWYRRTLAMDPSLTVAAKALEKLGATP